MSEQRKSTSPGRSDTIHYVGERNSIVFSAADGEPVPPVELPDDFFNISKEDVMFIYKEMKQKREQLEHQPFRTKAVREMEESAATLSNLKRYTQTVIRIQFPDRLVLQAVFNHSDTVQTVIDFVRNFLDPTDVQFQLYTAPPKTVLKPELNLIEAKLTPRALVYFSVIPQQDRTTFLKDSFAASLTNPALASEAAFKYRRELQDKGSEKPPQHEETPASSDQNVEMTKPKRSKGKSKDIDKVPKWFKR